MRGWGWGVELWSCLEVMYQTLQTPHKGTWPFWEWMVPWGGGKSGAAGRGWLEQECLCGMRKDCLKNKLKKENLLIKYNFCEK